MSPSCKSQPSRLGISDRVRDSRSKFQGKGIDVCSGERTRSAVVCGYFINIGNKIEGRASTAAAHRSVAERQRRDTPTGSPQLPTATQNKKPVRFSPLSTFTVLRRPKNGVASNRQLAEAASLRLLIFQNRPACLAYPHWQPKEKRDGTSARRGPSGRTCSDVACGKSVTLGGISSIICDALLNIHRFATAEERRRLKSPAC